MCFHPNKKVFRLPLFFSEELQDALGVTDKSLPPFIYRMRQLGYPPGWLKEAELENSGLALYDGKGNIRLDKSTSVSSFFLIKESIKCNRNCCFPSHTYTQFITIKCDRNCVLS